MITQKKKEKCEITKKELTKPKEIKSILEEFSFVPRKSWGQNFLTDETALNKIIESANPSLKDTFLEIGPGIGTLTLFLADKVKKIIAVEKDKKLIPILEKTLSHKKNILLKNKDILSFSPPEENYKVIGNIPYYITSPIIRKFLEEKNLPSLLLFTVQKEVAKRISARPPKMNLLAVCVQLYAKVQITHYIHQNSFWPRPSVDSAVIKITPHNNSHLKKLFFFNKSKDLFFKIVRAGFSHPRKQIAKNFRLLDKQSKKKIQLDAKELIKNAEKVGISTKRRAETLSVEEWTNLTESIFNNSQNL